MKIEFLSISIILYSVIGANATHLDTVKAIKPDTIVRKHSPPTDDPIFLDFIGTGDLQKSISDGEGLQANTSLGVLYERYYVKNKIAQSLDLEALINVATTADSISTEFNQGGQLINARNFGTYILNPVSAKQSFFINMNIYFKPNASKEKGGKFLLGVINGFNARLISSNNVWSYGDTTSINVSALSFRTGFFHEIIPDNYRLETEGKNTGRKKYSITLGLNYSFRGIYGDIKSGENKELRSKFLGSDQIVFRGFEFNCVLQLKNIRGEFQIPIFNGKDSIQGLTNTQFLFSIKFIGGLPILVN